MRLCQTRDININYTVIKVLVLFPFIHNNIITTVEKKFFSRLATTAE